LRPAAILIGFEGVLRILFYVCEVQGAVWGSWNVLGSLLGPFGAKLGHLEENFFGFGLAIVTCIFLFHILGAKQDIRWEVLWETT